MQWIKKKLGLFLVYLSDQFQLSDWVTDVLKLAGILTCKAQELVGFTLVLGSTAGTKLTEGNGLRPGGGSQTRAISSGGG